MDTTTASEFNRLKRELTDDLRCLPSGRHYIRGAFSKIIVVKHYSRGRGKKKIVFTRYPRMQGITPTSKQKSRRKDFRLAVRYARRIYQCPRKREESWRRLKKPWHLFQALMKEWYRIKKEKDEQRNRRLENWRNGLQKRSIIPQVLLRPGVEETLLQDVYAYRDIYRKETQQLIKKE